MKKIVLLILSLIFLSKFAMAEDKKFFMGYESYGQKERYMYVNEVDHAIMQIDYGEKGMKQILKHAVKCMNDNYWYKSKLISFKGKDDFYSYKFKFYWTLNSRIIYVDVNGNTLSCRE